MAWAMACAPPAWSDVPPDTAEARRLLGELGPAFGARYTGHFTILTDADAKNAGRLGQTAESTLKRVLAFADRLKMATTPLTRKLTIIYFDRPAAYGTYARRLGFIVNESVPGFFDQQTGRCIMFNYANSPAVQRLRHELEDVRRRAGPRAEAQGTDDYGERLREHERLINTTVFRHELAHQALFAFGLQSAAARDRRWLYEGLAMQFEGPTPVSRYRLADFAAIDWRNSGLSARVLIADPNRLAPQTGDASRAYAAAWALVYYLVDTRPDAFARYLRITPRVAHGDSTRRAAQNSSPGRGAPGDRASREIAAFVEVFGAPDESFERQWRRAIHQLAEEMATSPGEVQK